MVNWLNQQTVNLSSLGYVGSIPTCTTKINIVKYLEVSNWLPTFTLMKDKVLGLTSEQEAEELYAPVV